MNQIGPIETLAYLIMQLSNGYLRDTQGILQIATSSERKVHITYFECASYVPAVNKGMVQVVNV